MLDSSIRARERTGSRVNSEHPGPAHDEADPRDRALAVLHRHGRTTGSFQTLARELHYQFDGDDAFVAYADTGRAWVAAGPPVAPPERQAEVARAFVTAAQRVGRRPRLFAVDRELPSVLGLRWTRIGEEPVWDPRDWSRALSAVRSLREQLRRARAKGVQVRFPATEDVREGTSLRRRLDTLSARWLASKPMAPMGFIVQLDPFRLPEERLYVLAERAGEPVGLLVASPIYARGGWLVEHIVRDPHAPNGTAELLVDALMREVGTRGCDFVSLGLAPLAGPVRPWLRAARRAGRFLYNFEGLRAFKAKLRPTRWEPAYVAYPAAGDGPRAILDVLSAFAHGGLARFAARTVLRLRRSITGVLAALLVPWTTMLAVASASWFPSEGVKWAWVAFDVLLIGLMFGLVRRWRRGLVRGLAVLTGADAALTVAQVALYNVPRAETPLAWLLMGISVAAPTLATAFFTLCARDVG